MRIALFHDLPSGGAKRTLHELVKRLARRHRIDLYRLATADEEFCDLRPFTTPGRVFAFAPRPLFRSPLGRLNQLQRWRDLNDLARLGRDIAAAIDAGGYDAVLADASMWTQAPPLLCFLTTPALYNLHEPPRALYEPALYNRAASGWRRTLDRIDPLLALYRRAARRLDRTATRAARCAIVNSNFVRHIVRHTYGIEAVIAYHGVDVDHFRPRDDAPRRREILSVGALQPSKGFAFLIESLARIPSATRPPLRLVANAEVDGERARLTGLAAAHGVTLTIERDLSDAQLARRYAEATLFAYAPHGEPFGLAAIEAMSSATPVVAIAEGGVTESVVDGITGRLIGRDPGAFAAAIAALLADTAALRRLGASGRELAVQRWTWDRTAMQFEEALVRIAAAGAGALPGRARAAAAVR